MYLIVSGSDADFETASGGKGKVKFLIKHILLEDQVKHLRKTPHWPDLFKEKVHEIDRHNTTTKDETTSSSRAEGNESEEDDYMKGVFRNNNRAGAFDSDSPSSSDSESDE